MSSPLHNEIKKEFQLERLILFSDAVFAIAITLLVIEIKVPEIHGDVTDGKLLASLGHLIPKFIGFIISFLLIGVYWAIHHRIFGFVTSYNRKLIVLNLGFLFFIVLMPFSNAFYSEYAGAELFRQQLKVPMTFYVLNFCGAGAFNFWIWNYVSDPKNHLIEHPIDRTVLKHGKIRALVVPLVFLLMLPVAYIGRVEVAVYIPLLIPVIMRLVMRYLKKKEAPKLAAPSVTDAETVPVSTEQSS